MPSRVSTKEDEEKGSTPWVCLSVFIEVVPTLQGFMTPLVPRVEPEFAVTQQRLVTSQ